MPQPKKLITIEKISLLADHLRQLADVADRVVADSKHLKKDGVMSDGWPTCARAVQYIVDQLGKIAGPLAVSGVLPKDLLDDGQSFAATRKPGKVVQGKLEDATRLVAESKAEYSRKKKQPESDK